MQNEQATSTVIVNGEQAKQELTALEQKSRSLKEQLIAANKAGDGKAYEKLSKQLKNTQKEMKQLQKDSFDVKRVLDNLSGASMKELESAQKRLNAQLRSGDIKRNSKEWRENVEAQKKVKAEIKAINAEMQVSESRISKFANGFNKYFSSIAAGFAALAGVTLSLKKYSDSKIQLEDSKANLQALTGLNVDDIEWLTDQAKILSTELTETGVRIRQSSTEIVDAYTLVGSAKPELLENKEALKEVTEQTLILAAASKMDLKDAVNGITMAMNQYTAKAEEASRYTNVLAAGAKYGSAEVDSQTSAIIKSGVAAAQANIPIEALVGTIQTLAEKGIKDEIAGTGLKKFFLTLQTGVDETNPKVVGLEKALENLAAKQLSAAEIKKMFGEEGYNVAAVLLSETERVKYFTEAVANSNAAIEQASVNSETMAAKLAQAKNKLNEAGMEFVGKLNPAILSATNLSTKFIKLLVQMPRFLKENAFVLTSLVAIWTAYTVAVNASTIADKLKIFWTDKVTLSVKRLWVAVKANPWALAASGVILLLGWLNKQLNAQHKVNQKMDEYIKLAEKSKDLNQDTKSLEDRVKIMKSLSKSQLESLKNDLESQLGLLEDHDAAIKTQAKKLLDSDKEYQQAKKMFFEGQKTGNFGMQSAGVNKMNQREKTLLDQIATQYVTTDKAISSLKQNLTDVNSLLKTKGPDISIDTTDPDKAYKEQEKNLEKNYKQRTLLLNTMYRENLLKQNLYEQLSEDNELIYLENKIKLQKKFNKDTVDAEIDLINAKIKIDQNDVKRIEEHDKLVESMKLKEPIDITEEDPIIDTTKYTLATRLAIIEEFHEKGLISEREYLKRLSDLYKGNQTEINEYIKDENLKNNQEEFNSGIIGRKQYLENVRNITKLYWEEIFADQSELANKVLAVANKASDFVKTLAEAETLAVENKYAKQLNAARKAGEDTTALEEKLEEEKKQVKKKYADIDFAITVARIIAETSLAIMEAAPIVPLQILAGAAGLAEIAVANQQRESIKNLWIGGYTGSGGKYEPRGIVHAGEFVANQDSVNNGTLRRLFNLIDYAQKTNTVARIDKNMIAETIHEKGFSSGGFTGTFSQTIPEIKREDSSIDKDSLILLLNENKTIMSMLILILRKGINANVSVSGKGGIKEASDLYDELINNTQR